MPELKVSRIICESFLKNDDDAIKVALVAPKSHYLTLTVLVFLAYKVLKIELKAVQKKRFDMFYFEAHKGIDCIDTFD